MEHKLKLETYVNQSITVIEEENTITISVYNNTIEEYVLKVFH